MSYASGSRMQIFRDVDPNECSSTFSFGRPEDGKSMFMAGPFDGPERIHGIIQKLQKLGEGNYHFVFNAPVHGKTEAPDKDDKHFPEYDDSDEEYDDQVISDVQRLKKESIGYQSNPS